MVCLDQRILHFCYLGMFFWGQRGSTFCFGTPEGYLLSVLIFLFICIGLLVISIVESLLVFQSGHKLFLGCWMLFIIPNI